MRDATTVTRLERALSTLETRLIELHVLVGRMERLAGPIDTESQKEIEAFTKRRYDEVRGIGAYEGGPAEDE